MPKPLKHPPQKKTALDEAVFDLLDKNNQQGYSAPLRL